MTKGNPKGTKPGGEVAMTGYGLKGSKGSGAKTPNPIEVADNVAGDDSIAEDDDPRIRRRSSTGRSGPIPIIRISFKNCIYVRA